jgi:hypothetical protein
MSWLRPSKESYFAVVTQETSDALNPGRFRRDGQAPNMHYPRARQIVDGLAPLRLILRGPVRGKCWVTGSRSSCA